MPKKNLTSVDRGLVYLHFAWNNLCPKDDVDRTKQMVAEMLEDGVTDPYDHCATICGRLYDGLHSGNWPSVLTPKPRKK